MLPEEATPSAIKLTSPNEGEVWYVGENYSIYWNTTGSIPNVTVEYSTDNSGNWISIASPLSNVDAYAWTIPGSVSTHAKVRVSDNSNLSIWFKVHK